MGVVVEDTAVAVEAMEIIISCVGCIVDFRQNSSDGTFALATLSLQKLAFRNQKNKLTFAHRMSFNLICSRAGWFCFSLCSTYLLKRDFLQSVIKQHIAPSV